MTERATTQSIFLVDDDPGVLKALSRVLREEGWRVDTFSSAEEFLARADQTTDGCLVLDVTMPGINGLELQRRLAEAGQALPIVFLTGYGDIPMSVQAMKHGAVDFLTKPMKADALVAAVRTALEQDASARRVRADGADLRQRFASLTPREREVLVALVGGRINKQIAGDLGVVEQTVKFHRAQIMDRMRAKTVAELMHMAAQLGIGGATPSADPVAPSGESSRKRPRA